MRRTIVGLVLVAATLTSTACKDTKAPTNPTPKQLQACAVEVTVTKDEQPNCDLDGSQTLNVTGLSEGECADAGGQRDAAGVCRHVDY
jgi:hypothetical protein